MSARACTCGYRDQHVVNDLADIPPFASEDEEDAYWSTHPLGDAILDQMQPVHPNAPDFLPTRARKA